MYTTKTSLKLWLTYNKCFSINDSVNFKSYRLSFNGVIEILHYSNFLKGMDNKTKVFITKPCEMKMHSGVSFAPELLKQKQINCTSKVNTLNIIVVKAVCLSGPD